MIPKKYQNETDYRKIPREYLNSRIPQGRGKVRWIPFATVPEQFEQLQAFVEAQNKVAQPELSDNQCAMLNTNLHFKIMNNEPANVEYWEDGYFHQIQGLIRKIDMLNKKLILETGDTTSEVSMSQIICIN
ncbi:YolD-like family protein [Staphylococcus aureus]|uniref:YolD-like family protein n=1 Tax=Staphylococcus aureus TaxID=1280 RepID=UPI0027F952DB|nr:YolD-like family protein [Staphylococcus aureus]MDQ7134579.1 YolD-like family protein [Staphylococcus aureus]